MIAQNQPPEPKVIVCSNCSERVIPRVVPDEDPSAGVHRDVTFGHIDRPPEATHFHAECPICHHPLYAEALDDLNIGRERSVDWQMIILSLIAFAALAALAVTMSR